MPREPLRIFWERASARLAARINFAIWLEIFAPAAFGVCSLAAVLIYGVRRTSDSLPAVWLGLGLTMAVIAVWAWGRTRARRFGLTEGRVLLETTLRLDARLSAAAGGVATWPAERPDLPAVIRWRSLAAPGWLIAATLLLGLGLWAPLPMSQRQAAAPVEKAPALAETEAILQELERARLADPASLAQLATQVRELADRPALEQYTHSALEAADALRDQTVAAVRDLSRHLEAGADALAPLTSHEAARAAEKVSAAKDQLRAALAGLRGGRIAGAGDLDAAMEGARGALGNLSPEQIARLRQQLRQAAAAGRGIAGAAGQDANIVRDGDAADGDGEGYGRGGVTRGRGDAPLMLSSQFSPELTGAMQGVGTDDFNRAALGELAGTENGGAHQVDQTRASAAAAGGSVTVPAKGGEAAWVDRLAPADRAVLRDFFK